MHKILWLDNLYSRSTTFPGVKSSTLQLLDISNSFLFHPVEDCKEVFKSSHNLTVLNLRSINVSTNWSATNLLRLFMPLKSITTIILSDTSMKIIPSDVLKEIRFSPNFGSVEKCHWRVEDSMFLKHVKAVQQTWS